MSMGAGAVQMETKMGVPIISLDPTCDSLQPKGS